jgi:multiple sugar transport system substrate-binding protein
MSDENHNANDGDRGVGSDQLSRRKLLVSSGFGLAALASASAPGAFGAAKRISHGAAGTVSFGSNYSDPVPKKAMSAVLKKFTHSAGVGVKLNTVDHNTFQQQINSYLQGRPDDVFTWFAGYRMQFFAQKGLLSPIDDVWQTLTPQFSPALKAASTGLDGHQYFVPIYNYPWAVFYRKSVFKANGYKIPKTWAQYIALCKQMKSDGLTPIAFTDKDGWPAMGTFDYLNMRINGYDFHISLMAGKEAWDGPKVAAVFDSWRRLLEVSQPNSLGRTWQEAAQTLLQKKSGMYLLGTFVGQQFPKTDIADLDFFPFPEIDSNVGADAVEAPIDGFMMAKRPKNADGAKKLLEFLGTAPAENAYLATDSNDVAVHKDADTSKYNALQKRASELIGGAKSISQFLDRDADPTFASTVVIPAFQSFIKNPGDAASITKSMEAQKKSIYTS